MRPRRAGASRRPMEPAPGSRPGRPRRSIVVSPSVPPTQRRLRPRLPGVGPPRHTRHPPFHPTRKDAAMTSPHDRPNRSAPHRSTRATSTGRPPCHPRVRSAADAGDTGLAVPPHRGGRRVGSLRTWRSGVSDVSQMGDAVAVDESGRWSSSTPWRANPPARRTGLLLTSSTSPGARRSGGCGRRGQCLGDQDLRRFRQRRRPRHRWNGPSRSAGEPASLRCPMTLHRPPGSLRHRRGIGAGRLARQGAGAARRCGSTSRWHSRCRAGRRWSTTPRRCPRSP